MSLQEHHCPTCTCTQHSKNPVEPLPIEHGFAAFWEVYPRRGTLPKGHKGKSLDRWKKLSLENRRLAYRAARTLRQLVEQDVTLPKDAERFLALGADYWTDLAATQQPMPRIPVVQVVA